MPQRIHDSIHARIVPQDAGRKGTPQGVEAHARPVRHFRKRSFEGVLTAFYREPAERRFVPDENVVIFCFRPG